MGSVVRISPRRGPQGSISMDCGGTPPSVGRGESGPESMGSCLSQDEQSNAAGLPQQADQQKDPCQLNSVSLLPLPKDVEDLRLTVGYGNVNIFTYSELSAATKNFRADQVLGEGGFGIVYKGIIVENVRPGFESAQVVVKKLNPEGVQGDKEWLVFSLS
ncbi:unnamed protein product [Musa textilis]